MEASPCAQAISIHTTSLLTRLNLQRKRAQFCDCVVRQRQSPGQLYPAHRCVLAASSPVLASILSSTGALVELQAPCLSGSVLALILDYIYTGTLPYACSQQNYYNLLSAASHLQMDELQEALRAWQQTEVNDADQTNASTGTENQAYRDVINIHNITANLCSKYGPSTRCDDGFQRRKDTDTMQSIVSSPEQKDHQYSSSGETYNEAWMHSASRDSCIKGQATDTCNIDGGSHCGRKDASTLSDVTTCCSVSDHSTESSGNTSNSRQGQDLIQNIHCTTEAHGMSEVDKDVQTDEFHSPGTVILETWQKRTEGDLVRTDVERKSSCSSYSSSAHPCCGAVPVIRHSSRAATPYHPASLLSVISNRAAVSRSQSTHNDSIIQGITSNHRTHDEVKNQDYKSNENHTGTQIWDYQNVSDQCTTQELYYKSSADQCDMVEQDYSISHANYFVKQNDEHMDDGLSHITDHNDHHAHCALFQNKNHTQHFKDDSVPEKKIFSDSIRGFQNKTELSFDDFPSKHQSPDWSDCHKVSMSGAAEELSQDSRAVVSLPVEDSDTGSDSHCEYFCSEGDTKEEHSYSSRCPPGSNRQDLHSSFYRPKTSWYSKLNSAETNWQDAVPSRNEDDLDNGDTAMEDERHSADVSFPISSTQESSLDNITEGLFAFERCNSLEIERITDSEMTEPQITFPMPVDSNMSLKQSYHGHLHYHCLPQGDVHLYHKRSHPSHTDYSGQSSDEEEEVSPGHSSLRKHFAARTTDQVLLLDISAKPAELLTSYKHTSDKEEKNHTSGLGVRSIDKEQRNEATSVVGANKRKIITRTKFRAETFDEGDTKSWAADTNVGERKSVGKEQSRLGADIIHKAGVVEVVSNPKEGENHSSTLTVCSPPCVPDTVQASRSSTLSVCIAPTLTVSMPTNTSTHLSTPLHQPFQCPLCDRSFSQRGSLNRHVRSHLGVRPFPCPCCPMTFSRQYRVTEHMRVHQRCSLGIDFHKPPTSSI